MNKFSFELFEKIPLIGIIRGLEKEAIRNIIKEFKLAGLTTIEITLNTEHALELIKDNVSTYGESLNIGAGSVRTMDELLKSLDAGSQFIVSPILNRDIVIHCEKMGIPCFPGAFTPTEVHEAWTLGATMVKVFPGGLLGAAYIKELKAPLQDIKLLPTGGVTLENMDEFIHAGADGFGLGSSLIDKKLIEDGNWVGLNAHFRKFIATWEKHQRNLL